MKRDEEEEKEEEEEERERKKKRESYNIHTFPCTKHTLIRIYERLSAVGGGRSAAQVWCSLGVT